MALPACSVFALVEGHRDVWRCIPGARSGRHVLSDKHSDQWVGYKMQMMKSLPATAKAKHQKHCYLHMTWVLIMAKYCPFLCDITLHNDPMGFVLSILQI